MGLGRRRWSGRTRPFPRGSARAVGTGRLHPPGPVPPSVGDVSLRRRGLGETAPEIGSVEHKVALDRQPPAARARRPAPRRTSGNAQARATAPPPRACARGPARSRPPARGPQLAFRSLPGRSRCWSVESGGHSPGAWELSKGLYRNLTREYKRKAVIFTTNLKEMSIRFQLVNWQAYN